GTPLPRARAASRGRPRAELASARAGRSQHCAGHRRGRPLPVTQGSGGHAPRRAFGPRDPGTEGLRRRRAACRHAGGPGQARYLEELRRFRPDIAQAVNLAVDEAAPDLDFVRLDPQAFSGCPSQSVDYAVMERTEDAAVVAARFEWNDVGSWRSLWTLGEKDAAGNSQLGDVILEDASGCYVRAESRLVAALGVENLVIVETGDAVLVAHKDKAEDVKGVVEQLKARDRPEQASHDRVYRPWGYYESIDAGAAYQVKRLMLKKGARISLQRHRRRAEHWVVVAGKARVTRGDEQVVLGPNQSTFIPLGTIHRLENVGEEPLFV